MSTESPAGSTRAGLIAFACAEAVWLTVLLVLPLVMNVSLMRTFEASKLGAVAPLAALGLAALAAAALAGGFAGMRRMLTSVPVLCFGALIAVAIAATLASQTRWVAFFGDYFRREGLLSWLVYAALFGSLLAVLRRRAQVERIVDVLLLSTVIPCTYAVMQRYGFDFFVTHGLLVGTAGARPGGTMGNPVFLASVLLLIIPVTLARLLAPADSPRPSVPPLARYVTWPRVLTLLLLGLQLFTVVLSQSRGPGLGLALALALYLILLGAWRRHRLPIGVALAASLLLAAGLAAINFVPALVQAVQGTPLQRFVFSGSDTNITSRVGIWQAGVSVLVHAPWWRQLLGWGPDSAVFSYYQWIPAVVQRNEGYAETIDRMHSQFFEVLQSFGLLGAALLAALVAALVWSAAGRLLPAPGASRTGWIGYAALNLAGLAAGALLAAGAGGSAGFAPIGAGAGLAFAWLLFLARRGWRSAAAPAAAQLPPDDALLIAALVSALIGSWVETLVGVPTIASLSLTAVYAALIVLGAHGAWRRPEPAAPAPAAAAPATAADSRKARKSKTPPRLVRAEVALARSSDYPILGWAVATCLMIAVVDFFPPLTGVRILAPSPMRLPLIAWPLALLALTGLALAFAEGRRGHADPFLTLTRFLLWSAPPALLFTLVYFAIGDSLTGLALGGIADRVASLVELGYGACLAMPLLLAAALYWADPARTVATRRAGWAVPALLAAGAILALAVFVAVSTDVRADVRAKLMAWALNQQQATVALDFAREARALVPGERRYSSLYAARLVESAAAEARSLASQPDAGVATVQKFREAARVLAEARADVQRDPWLAFGYANAHLHLASPQLGNLVPPGERAQHAAEARKYFALAHQEFPGQPWFLRGWSELEIDQGNRAAAYARLTEMEQMDPRNFTAYPDWASYARLGPEETKQALAAVRRGLAVMPKGSDDAAGLLEMRIEIARQADDGATALAAALEATATDPERIRPWRQLAEIYELAGQQAIARSNAENALARFAGRNLAGDDATDFAALKAQVERLTPGQPAPPAAAR